MVAIDVDAPSRQVRRALIREAAKLGSVTAQPTRSGLAEMNRAPAETPNKGLFDGNCNRTACQQPISGDNWFNTSTEAYYCRRCAHLINVDAQRFDGVRICVSVDDPKTRPAFPYEMMERFREERMQARSR